MIKLHELLETVEVIKIKNNIENLQVKGVKYYSGEVTPGDIFVCIKGYKSDGHNFISEAIKRGAAVLVVEKIQKDITSLPQVLVENARSALSAISNKLYGNPSSFMNIIGITGTNGKTTTSFMTDKILKDYGFNTGLMGSVKIKYDDCSEPANLTTPESSDLHHYLHQMRLKNVSHLTMEVSSSALQLNRVDNVNYDVVVLNNISREHIDLHGSFEDYFNSKASLIRNATARQWAIINLDCPYSVTLTGETKANLLTFGIKNKEGDISCEDLDLSTGRASYTFKINRPFKTVTKEYRPGKFNIRLSTPGYHSVYNSMIAIMIGMLYGVSIESIQKSLYNFVGVERRFEYIFEDDFVVIDDHFANTGNIDVTMETLQLMNYKDLKLVYAIRGGRGPVVNKENAEAIAKWAPKAALSEIFATLSKSHTTDKDKVFEEEVEAFMEVMQREDIKVYLYEELPDAIYEGLSCVGSQNVVLLAGCQGMDNGARIALEQLSKLRPGIDKIGLFKPLEKRVAGML